MKQLVICIFLLLLGVSLYAQEIIIPKNLNLETKEDYIEIEPLVLKSIKWLQEHPLAEDRGKRQELNAFLMKWMIESPTVSIVLVEGVVPAGCFHCMMIFMTGWSEYTLKNNYSRNKVEGALAGVERAIVFYKKNRETLGKRGEMDKLIKLQKKKKLRKYIESKF